MEKLKKHIHDDSNGLDYVLVGDTIFQTYSCRRKAAQSDGGDGCTGNICKSIVPTGTMNCFCLESCGHILPIWMSRHRTVWMYHCPDKRNRGSHGGIESKRPACMGRSHEQHTPPGRGSHSV